MKRTGLFPKAAALLSSLALVSIAQSTFGAAVPVDPKTTLTATMDGGTAKTGNSWYEVGVNSAATTTGLKTGLVFGQTDPLSTYLIQPAAGKNALMLDNSTKNGTITFVRPLSVTALSLAGASGNGRGTNVLTLHFTDGTTDTLPALTVGDWFNVEPRVQTTRGRIDVGANTFNNVNADNPRLLAVNATLSAADATKTISSVDFSWTGSGTTTHTAIFGVSGDVAGLGHFSAIPLATSSFNQDMVVGASEIIPVVPEPSTLVLSGLGAVSLLAFLRGKRAK